MKKKSELVNFMKGIAIMGVVLYHLISGYLNVPSIIKTASSFGGAGVHIFIVCSGFGLAVSFLNRNMNWFEFIKKRFTKIYIPYIVIVLVSFCVPFMYTGNDRGMALLSHIFMYKMFVPQYESSFGPQFWYISTIFQFYFVFCGLVKLKKHTGTKKFLFISCGVSLLWSIFTVLTGLCEERIWSSFFLQYLWEFSIGMCLADLYQKEEAMFEKFSLRKVACVSAISFVLYMGMSLYGGTLKNFNDLFSVLAFGGLCLLVYEIKCIRCLFSRISKISFELFLIHMLVFAISKRLLSRWMPNVIVCIIALIACMAGAYLYHKLMNFIMNRAIQRNDGLRKK